METIGLMKSPAKDSSSNRGVLLFFFCLTVFNLLPRQAKAFSNDTHYFLKYELLLEVGFDPDDAEKIANADVSVDSDPDTRYNLKDWHACGTPAENDARRDFLRDRAMNEPDPELALIYFGQFLHFLEDMSSHVCPWYVPYWLWAIVDHAVSYEPDYLSSYSIEEIEMMIRNWLDYMKNFFTKIYPGQTPNPVTWDDVEGIVGDAIEANPTPNRLRPPESPDEELPDPINYDKDGNVVVFVPMAPFGLSGSEWLAAYTSVVNDIKGIIESSPWFASYLDAQYAVGLLTIHIDELNYPDPPIDTLGYAISNLTGLSSADEDVMNAELYLSMSMLYLVRMRECHAIYGSLSKDIRYRADFAALLSEAYSEIDKAGTEIQKIETEPNSIDFDYLAGSLINGWMPLRHAEQLALAVCFSPQPADNATGVPRETCLSWEPGYYANRHDVYFGTDSESVGNATPLTPGLYKGRHEQVNYIPESLQYNTTYYWRIDEVDDANTCKGNVWSFTTTPLIITQPVSVSVFPGQTAVFTIGTDTAVTPYYAWYKTSDAANNTPEDDILVNEYTDSLTLTDITSTFEGYYFCKVTVPPETAYSDVVVLSVKRKMAHWTLDDLTGGHYSDSSGENHPAIPNGTVMFVPGRVNNAVQITPDSGWALAGTWNPSQYTGQLTISLWAKWAGLNGNWQGLIGKRTSWTSNGMMWQVEATQNPGFLQFKNTTYTVSSAVLPNGEWEHMAVTFNGTTATIYRDGISAASGTFAFNAKTDANMNIGASQINDAGTAAYIFNGALDDIQIYNYALTITDIADIYRAVTGESVCIFTYASAYDYNRNCVVDLGDLIMFAHAWLECGLYPESSCP